MTNERIDHLLREATLNNDADMLDLLRYVRQLERHVTGAETRYLTLFGLLSEALEHLDPEVLETTHVRADLVAAVREALA